MSFLEEMGKPRFTGWDLVGFMLGMLIAALVLR